MSRILLVCVLFLAVPAIGDDWPQWMGPQRDSVWREKGIVEGAPKDGLKTQWRIPVGQGYSTPSVVNGVVYLTEFVPNEEKTTENPGLKVGVHGTERVRALDAKTGTVLWTHEYPEHYTISYPKGPRVQPTVVNGQLFTIGAQGRFSALDAATGKVIWEKKLTETFQSEPPLWGYASPPLVDGDLVYANVGNKSGAAVAFHRATGEIAWQALPAKEPGYGPPTLIEHKGKKELLIFHAEGLNSVDPLTGKLNWSVPLVPDHGMAITAPRKEGNLLFLSGPPRHSFTLRLTEGAPQEVWHLNGKSGIHAANATPFVHDGIAYGNDALTGAFRAVSLIDGHQLWETLQPTTGTRRVPYGTVFTVRNEANGHYYLFSENGDLIVADLDASGYKELGRRHLLDPTGDAFGRGVAWSHPAFADKSIFVRSDKELIRVDLAKDSYPAGIGAAIEGGAKASHAVSLEEAGAHILTMTRFGVNAYFELMKDKEEAKQFTKNDLWAKVDVTSVHKEVFPALSYLYNYFPDNYVASQRGAKPSSRGPAFVTDALKKWFGEKPQGTKEFLESEAFLDEMDATVSRLEEAYRKVRAGAKPVAGVPEGEFQPTNARWYPERTDKDDELWKVFSELAALEYYLYRATETDIDLAEKYKSEASVRVRDPKSEKTLEDYFEFSKNPKRAVEIARRMAKLEKAHLDLYGLYRPMRELLVRFLAYHWEFHDLLLPGVADERAPAAIEATTHSGEAK
jgi:outer membrane protein assembly factor BamB